MDVDGMLDSIDGKVFFEWMAYCNLDPEQSGSVKITDPLKMQNAMVAAYGN